MPKRGKKYLEAAKLVNPDAFYSPEEAVDLVKQTIGEPEERTA